DFRFLKPQPRCLSAHPRNMSLRYFLQTLGGPADESCWGRTAKVSEHSGPRQTVGCTLHHRSCAFTQVHVRVVSVRRFARPSSVRQLLLRANRTNGDSGANAKDGAPNPAGSALI